MGYLIIVFSSKGHSHAIKKLYTLEIDLVVDIPSVIDTRIDQFEGCSPESCLSWLRSQE